MAEALRIHFQEELAELERQALGGLDMVVSAAEPTTRDGSTWGSPSPLPPPRRSQDDELVRG